MSREQLLRRIALLEAALAPKPKLIWDPWQRILSDEEHELIVDLALRGARHGGNPSNSATWCDDPEAWASLCRDGRERELLGAVMAKATDPAVVDRVERLWLYMLDLRA
jgi:hypothetical protein